MRYLFAANKIIYLTQWYLLFEWPRSLWNLVTLNQLKFYSNQLNLFAWWNASITQIQITLHRWYENKKTQIKAAMLAAPLPTFHAILTKHDWLDIYNCQRTGCRQLNFYSNQINRFIKNVFQINLYLKSIKFSHCRFNATFHWIQIDISDVVNEYSIDSIKKYSMISFNWIN